MTEKSLKLIAALFSAKVIVVEMVMGRNHSTVQQDVQYAKMCGELSEVVFETKSTLIREFRFVIGVLLSIQDESQLPLSSEAFV